MRPLLTAIEAFLNVGVQIVTSPVRGLMWLLDNWPSVSVSFHDDPSISVSLTEKKDGE